MRKIFPSAILFSTALFGTVLWSPAVDASTPSEERQSFPVIVSVFVREDCKHCQAEKAFLTELRERLGNRLQIRYLDIKENPRDKEKFIRVTEELGLMKGTPVTLVGGKIFQGFDSEETTGKMILEIIQSTSPTAGALTFDDVLADPNSVEVVSSLAADSICADSDKKCETGGLTVRIPFLDKQLDLSTYSLSAVSLILGLIDGFNPCALWVLVMFLTLLLQTGSRRRMWQYAGLFILAEAVMYYLILTVWFKTWDFIGLSQIVTPLVGALAVGSGIYFLYKWSTWKPVCSATGDEQKKNISNRITALVRRPMTLGVVVGILALAFSVNVFEFACSIGIPQAYTKILELNDLGFWGTQFQMMLYIAMYMLDDVVVFALALFGAHKLSGMMRYSKWSTLVGGVLMLILGFLMIFSPETLVF